MEVLKAQKAIESEFKVDSILKKIKVLEGVVQENVLHKDLLDWAEAYDKHSLFMPLEQE